MNKLQQKSFQRPLKKAKNEIAIAAPFNKIFLKNFAFLESSGMGFLMRFQFWSCLATFIFGLYVMVGPWYFWLAWLDSPCWGQIEAGAKLLGMILSIRVRRKPIWSLVISASVLSWDIQWKLYLQNSLYNPVHEIFYKLSIIIIIIILG